MIHVFQPSMPVPDVPQTVQEPPPRAEGMSEDHRHSHREGGQLHVPAELAGRRPVPHAVTGRVRGFGLLQIERLHLGRRRGGWQPVGDDPALLRKRKLVHAVHERAPARHAEAAPVLQLLKPMSRAVGDGGSLCQPRALRRYTILLSNQNF